MRRLQLYIDEDMDDLLAVEARRLGRSKASLIREAVREQYGEPPAADALDDWVGSVDAELADIDSVVCGE